MVIRLNKHGQAWNLNVLKSRSSKRGGEGNNLFGNKGVLDTVI